MLMLKFLCHHRPRRIAAALALSVLAASAHAQTTWYLAQDMAKDTSWKTPSLWNSAPDGSGTPALSINSADTYNTNGKLVRTNGVFTGGMLVQPGGRIDIKRASQTITGDWEVAGDKATLHQGVRENASYLFTVQGKLILTSPLIVLHTTDGMRGIDLTLGAITGPSDLIIGSGNAARNTTVSLGVSAFENYTGTITVRTGSTLLFANDQKWTGPLDVRPGAFLMLNRALSVPSATLAGKALEPGAYTADQIGALHPGLIVAGSTGTLAVGP